jgi:hypothetical protein
MKLTVACGVRSLSATLGCFRRTMLYAFCDEDNSKRPQLNFACVLFYQNRYRRGVRQIQALRDGGSDFSQKMKDAIHELGGFCVASTFRFPARLMAPGVVDGTREIPRMARLDTAWGIGMILTVATALRRVPEEGWNFRTVDLYYDSKSLTVPHRDAIHETLRGRMTHYANEYARVQRRNRGKTLAVSRFSEVVKPGPNPPNQFQLGVWSADRVVRRAEQLSGGAIELHDLSTLGEETLEQWEADSTISGVGDANAT